MEHTSSFFRGPKRLRQMLNRWWHPENRTRHAGRDEKIPMWISGQKVTLSVEDWLRGH